jgi:hypothetical protein
MSNPVVTLTWYEVLMAQGVASLRQSDSEKKGLNLDKHGVKNLTRSESDRIGALCEVATAKYLNVFWPGHVGLYGGADLEPNIAVRGTKHRFGHLIFRPGENPAFSYVLIIQGKGTFELAGYLNGWEMMEHKEWYDALDKSRADYRSWNAPQRALHPINDLRIAIQRGNPVKPPEWGSNPRG